MRFANPSALQLLWLVPVILVLAVAFEHRTRKRLSKAFGEKLTPFLSSSLSPARRRLKLVLRLVAVSFFILALARPQMGKSQQEVKSRGVEIVVAFDVSTSMLAEDVKPSRLQHAKSELMRLLEMLSGDKVGLVAFAGSATLISPLTTDRSALKMFVDSLSTESVETQGTNFQRALNEAAKAFERGGVENDETARVTRVILVISDGEDQEQGALKEARDLVANGTRIFTLAFGTERGGPIPLRDERGFMRGYKKDKNGQNVMSTVKGTFLRELAQVGQGSFHHATFGGQEAKLIREDLDKLEKAEFASALMVDYDEKFQIPLLIGLLFALVELLLGERRAAGRIWKGRFEVSES
jgi:Ca-activated chloride channel homolog